MARLGWIKSYLDEKTGELKIDFAVSETQLDDKTIGKFDEVVGYIAEFRPFLLDYMIVRENFFEISRLDREISQLILNEGFKNPGTMTIKAHTLCQQKFMNFLLTSASMCGHYKIRISRNFGRKSREFYYISRIENRLKERFISFKICHCLRNFVAHHTLPIDNIPSKFSKESETAWRGGHKYILKKENLLKNREVRKELGGILDDIPEIIPLSEIIDEYFRILSRIFLRILKFFRPRFATVIQYRTAVMKHKPDIEGARPVLWWGDMPSTDGDHTVNLTEFSFDEVDFIFKIVHEINGHRRIFNHPSSVR